LANGEQKEKGLITCQNDMCGRSFVKPLMAFDIRANSGEAYEACPFCLSKVKATDQTVLAAPPDETPSAPSKGTTSCAHYLGYLCNRTEKNRVPDECMLCADIVSCMLHSLKK
jgi:hypothetical protein